MVKTAVLSLESQAPIASVDRRLFGSFLEHLGRAVYTGIYQPGHPAADEMGFRTDVLKLVQRLQLPLVRYPGGNFVSGYRWEDGIGPKESRPRRLELAWGVIEPNLVGVDEFAQWAKAAGAEVMMAVNLGTRGIQEAQDLLEYCNHPSGTYWSDLRAQNGHPEPYGIRTWCLGNEMDGPWQIGHKTAREYGRLAAETAKVMRWVDPAVELVACGSSGRGMITYGKWEDQVLDLCGDQVDYVSLYTYYGCRDGDTQSFLTSALDMEAFIREVAAICDGVCARNKWNKQINLSFDEWNVWYHSSQQDQEIPRWSQHPHQLEDIYLVEDAVLVGSMLITLMRCSDRVRIACLAQLVNVIAPIMTEENGSAWCQTIYYPFLHASLYGRGEALNVGIQSPSYSCARFTEAKAVDAVAVQNGEELTIFAVNRSLDEDVQATLDLRGYGQADGVEHILYTHEDIKAHNGPDQSQNILPQSLPLQVQEGQAQVFFPRVSWNVLRFRLK